MSRIKRIRPGGADPPIIGSGPMPDFFRNESLPALPGEPDSITADLQVLLTRNEAQLNFRATDIEGMDLETKRVLLSDLQMALGITPLKRLKP